VFLAVELGSNDVNQPYFEVGKLGVRTSLTGIEETPISIAMNQHALIQNVNGTPHIANVCA
jgi:hypothetical protein